MVTKKVHALAIMLLIIGFKYSSQFTATEMWEITLYKQSVDSYLGQSVTSWLYTMAVLILNRETVTCLC